MAKFDCLAGSMAQLDELTSNMSSIKEDIAAIKSTQSSLVDQMTNCMSGLADHENRIHQQHERIDGCAAAVVALSDDVAAIKQQIGDIQSVTGNLGSVPASSSSIDPSEVVEQVRKSINILIHQVPESSPDGDVATAKNVIDFVSPSSSDSLVSTTRLRSRGRDAGPLLLTFSNPGTVRSILRNNKLLHSSTSFKKFKISDDLTIQQSTDLRNLRDELKRRQTADKPNVTTHAQLSQQFVHHSQLAMGTKRGRFLMRQQRIKKEHDGNHPSDGDSTSVHYLTVPPLRMERQCSDPLPTNSPPPGSLLAVPASVLLKQHSHPLLLSQSRSYSPPSNLSFVHSSKLGDQAERAISPVVVVTDPLSVSQELPLKGDVPQLPTASLRVRTDELKRSASSPQTSTRSTHCPVVRPGPALGCNYCWNTVDAHGRILRRKTKYHCPECQTNLCIVPCFQEYHERHMNPSQTDPIALTTSVMRVFPKTTSM